MTRRRWLAEEWSEKSASISGAQATHLVRVLRGEVGMEADVAAGGRVFHARVAELGAERVVFELHEEIAADAVLPVTLALAVFKFDRLEWAIEKAVELGVGEIVPVLARRTEKHLAQSAAKRVERWRRIAHEAAQQSRRAAVPLIHEPVALRAIVKRASESVRILLAETEREGRLRRVIESALEKNESAELPNFELAIGPEGGWAEDELKMFAEAGWVSASLGPRILRAETAAIAALTVAGSLLD